MLKPPERRRWLWRGAKHPPLRRCIPVRSPGQTARLQRVLDKDADYVEPLDMLAELREHNKACRALARGPQSLRGVP